VDTSPLLLQTQTGWTPADPVPAGQPRVDTRPPLTSGNPSRVTPACACVCTCPRETTPNPVSTPTALRGATIVWDPVAKRPRYRCGRCAHLAPTDPGGPCRDCARVRRAHQPRRRRTNRDPMPGQRPLVGVVPTLPTPRQPHDQPDPIAACTHCDHNGRTPDGRWCHHGQSSTRGQQARDNLRAQLAEKRTQRNQRRQQTG
jgi:hypothetical protein